MLKFNSIKTRLIFYLLISLLPIFAVLIYAGEGYIEKILYKNALLSARMSALEAARDIENLTFAISIKPKEISTLAGDNLSSLNGIERLMKKDLVQSKFIYGMALAFLPKFAPNKGYFCQYYYLKNKKIRSKQLIPPSYSYLTFDWFKKPILLGKNLWSEPYFDKGGGQIQMSTYSAVIRNGKKEAIGIATADVSIRFLSEIINRIKILKTGGAFLFTKNGDILAPTQKEPNTKSSVAEILKTYNEHDLKKISHIVLKNNTYLYNINIKGQKYLTYYTRVRNTNWIIGTIFPDSELLWPMKTMEFYSLIIVLLAAFVVIFIIIFVSRKVTEDIGRIKNISSKIATGNFDVKIPSNLVDESKDVAKALDVMQKSLKKFIQDVKEKAKIENELKLAKKIQSSFIPQDMEIQINGVGFKAMSYSARQVGGDFYGINKLCEDKIIFYLGDVSGKGIPAVLYVAMIKSMIEVLVKQTHSILQITEFLNNYISGITKNNTFATMFIGLIDKQKNIMEFCNAGHTPPLMFKENSVFMSTLSSNIPLGALSGFRYKMQTVGLKNLNTMVIYSDGITDALNSKNEQFGEDRMIDAAMKSIQNNNDIAQNIKKELFEFINGNDLYDDTTLLRISFT